MTHMEGYNAAITTMRTKSKHRLNLSLASPSSTDHVTDINQIQMIKQELIEHGNKIENSGNQSQLHETIVSLSNQKNGSDQNIIPSIKEIFEVLNSELTVYFKYKNTSECFN